VWKNGVTIEGEKDGEIEKRRRSGGNRSRGRMKSRVAWRRGLGVGWDKKVM